MPERLRVWASKQLHLAAHSFRRQLAEEARQEKQRLEREAARSMRRSKSQRGLAPQKSAHELLRSGEASHERVELQKQHAAGEKKLNHEQARRWASMGARAHRSCCPPRMPPATAPPPPSLS